MLAAHKMATTKVVTIGSVVTTGPLFIRKSRKGIQSSSSLPSGFGFRRWNSLKSSTSLNSPFKVPLSCRKSWRFSSLTRNNKARSQASVSMASEDRASTSSLNSLSDGRTPWPVPWLDAIFLPDYPNRAPIADKDFVTLGTIATGAFGKVYRVCLRKQPDTVYAMKVQKKSEVIGQDAVQQVKHEVSIHYALCGSPFVTRLHFAWQSRSNLYMVLHYVTGYGDLHQLWRDEGPFDDELVAVYVAEIACALDYIHNCGVIFRDLKMENILLDDNGHIQIIDFGLAKWLHFGDRTKTICGTLYYMAPEILRLDSYNHSVDWWSLGVLMHALLTGAYPFPVGKDHTSMYIPQYFPAPNLSADAQVLLMKVHPFDYFPRMRRCNTCNQDIDIESVITGSTNPFEESYDLFRNFEELDETDV